MAPAAKKSKTVPAAAGAAGSLQKLFASQGAKPATPTEEPGTVAPAGAAQAKVASDVAPKVSTPIKSAPEVPQVTPTGAAVPAASGSSGKPGLSAEQLLKIEENRRKALERQQAKKRALEEGDCGSPSTSASPSSTSNTSSSPQTPAAGDAPAASSLTPAKPFAALSKAAGKAKAKAGSAKPRGKAKAEPQSTISPFAAAGPNGSPAKTSQGGANITTATPEKTPPPAQEKRASPVQQGVPATGGGAANASAGDAVALGKFGQPRLDDWRQYAAVYVARLRHLRGYVMEEARALWGGVISPDGFRPEISGYRHGGIGAREVVIVGVLFKDLKSRPSVIEQFRENPLCSRGARAWQLVLKTDALFLEDASMRLRLNVPSEQVGSLCTGLVVAVKGSATSEGGFDVTSMVFARLPPPPALQTGCSDDIKQGPFMAMVSGLAPPDPATAASLSEVYGKLIEFLAQGSECKVQSLLICGGALCSRSGVGHKMTKEELAAADDLLARLAGVVPVQVMPGKADPTNFSLPQAPLHPHLFRRARACPLKGSMRCVSNPYSEVVDSFGVSLLGHSGQPVQDILRCTRGTTPLGALRMCLEALHLAPTAPDTLAAPPFEGEDPFVIKDVPHVLFSGGHLRAEQASAAWHGRRGGDSMHLRTSLPLAACGRSCEPTRPKGCACAGLWRWQQQSGIASPSSCREGAADRSNGAAAGDASMGDAR
eukprot:CAMPEP_0115348390 /NCGR_PEP_ID=MMETSP0270-20121206/95382_1 /TAXON_ID=71861 /ORGANISM="Scrippsiella trochoidea, Strain CCMP3099" /LENGTH=712 /DNA_ID=CAMNT_0002770363 /DNA_START=88 /DNA_END=2228 /DNA_ORIENTATION=-